LEVRAVTGGKFSKIRFGTGLAVTEEGAGVIRVDASAGSTVDISGKVDRDAVETATARLVQVKLLVGDTQPAFRIEGDGKHRWGQGGTTAPDTTLYRVNPGGLKTDGNLYTATTRINSWGMVGEGNIDTSLYFGGDFLTSLYRPASGTLKTGNEFQGGKWVWVNHDSSADKTVLIGNDLVSQKAAIVLGQDTHIFRWVGGIVGISLGAVLGTRGIEAGPPDSGGAGYRMLRVSNS
jgi:hypothetical protein